MCPSLEKEISLPSGTCRAANILLHSSGLYVLTDKNPIVVVLFFSDSKPVGILIQLKGFSLLKVVVVPVENKLYNNGSFLILSETLDIYFIQFIFIFFLFLMNN